MYLSILGLFGVNEKVLIQHIMGPVIKLGVAARVGHGLGLGSRQSMG